MRSAYIGQVRSLLLIRYVSADASCRSEDKGIVAQVEPVTSPDKFAVSVSGERVIGVLAEVWFVELCHGYLDFRSFNTRLISRHTLTE